MKRETLKGRWAVVTGADSGIGLCFSHELARLGCPVVMVSNVAERLRKEAAWRRTSAWRHWHWAPT